MPKQSGLGQRFFVGGFDLSGDTGSASKIGGGPAALELTGIDKLAYERVGGLRTGEIDWSSWFNPDAAGAHPVLSALPYADVNLSWLTSTTLGDPAASMVAKQIDYAPERAQDGSMAIAVAAMSNAYGIEWGQTLTAGLRTDTTATNGASIDTLASASFGAQAYLHVTAFTGTSVAISIEDSANNSAWTAVSGLAFTSVTGATSERLQLSATATVRRYLRVVTTGTFTSASFVVAIVKNQTATVF